MPTYSARAAAIYCGVSDKTMRRWIESGAIPAQRDPEDARAYLVDQADLDASGRVRHKPAAAAPIADVLLRNGHLAVPEESNSAMDAVMSHLRETSAAADARAAAAEEQARHWAFEAGQWKTRYEALEQQQRAAADAANAAPPKPWWARLLGR